MRTYKILILAGTLSLAACGDAMIEDGESLGEDSDNALYMSNQAVTALQAEVPLRHADQLPAFVTGNLGTVATESVGLMTADSALKPSLAKLAPAFALSADELSVADVRTEATGARHIRYSQKHAGRRVVGGDLVVHLDAQGTLYAAHGSARANTSVAEAPEISEADALAAVQAHYAEARVTVSGPELVYLFSSRGESMQLAYEFLVEGSRASMPLRDHVYVSAITGAVADVHPHIHSALARKVYTAKNGTSLPGTLKRSEGGSASGDGALDAAYDNTGTTYNFYKTLFGRDSYDDAGATLISSVHYDQDYANAYWDGTQMVYGDGDGSEFTALSKSLDVTAHELTHAVTENTANLTYQNEPGALNEAMSDIMGESVEAWSKNGNAANANTWLVGEDIYTPGTSGDALRYMNNPTKDGYSADYYPDRITGTDDNGGVHGNSGIANLAFYLLVQGGSHPRNKTSVAVAGIGLPKAEAIFYRALTLYMSASTKFAGARTATLQAATDLYGASSAEAIAVQNAWAAVGVGSAATGTSSGSSTSGTTTSSTTLSNGVPVTDLALAKSKTSTWTMAVPAGATALKFAISGGTGNADLFVKFGSAPTTSSYDCRPYKSGNSESCSISSAQTGTYYVMLRARSAFSGVTLTGTYSAASSDGGGTSSSGNVLTSGTAVTGISGSTGFNTTVWTVVVPSGTNSLTVAISGGTGDADLYVRRGSAPTTSSYDERPYLEGNEETVTLDSPTAGTYYVKINGYAAYTGVQLLATLQ